MVLYLVKGFINYAATSLTDAQALLAALADPSTETNSATIDRVMRKLDALVQSDTAEPITLSSIDDTAGTISSWVTNAAVDVQVGLGDPEANNTLLYAYAPPTAFAISGSTRTATLALNTAQLQSAVGGAFGRPPRSFGPRFTLHIRISSLTSSETVGLIPIAVAPGVINGAPANLVGPEFLTLTQSDARYLRQSQNLADVGSAAAAFAQIKQAATTSATGVVELTTDAEAIAGTDAERALTAAALKAALLARATPIPVKLIGAEVNGSTDDRAAIQAALDSGLYPHLVVEGGTCLIASVNPSQSGTGLRLPSNTRLTIAHGATLKRGSNSITALVINKSTGVTGGYTANSNITLDGGGTIDGNSSVYTASCTLVAFGHCTGVTIRDLSIVNTPGYHAIEINGCKRTVIERVNIDTCIANEAIQLDTMKDANVWLWFGPFDGTQCDDTRIYNCTFTNVQDGVGSHSDPAALNTVIAFCRFIGCTGVGVKPNGYTNLTVLRCDFSGCATAFTAPSGSNVGIEILNNYVTGCTSVDINLINCTVGVCSGNVIRSGITGILNIDASITARNNSYNNYPVLDSSWLGIFDRSALYCTGAAGRAAPATAMAAGSQDKYFSLLYLPYAVRANTFLIEASPAGFGLRSNFDGSLTVRQAGVADILSTPAGVIVVNQPHFIEVWWANGVLSIAVNGGAARATVADTTDYYGTSPALSSTAAVAAWGLLARGLFLNYALTTSERAAHYARLGLLAPEMRGGSLTPVTAGSFVTGRRYRIVSVGTTNFVSIGASASTVNVVFTATGAGSGTGTAVPAGAIWALGDADKVFGTIIPDVSGNGNNFTLSSTAIAPAYAPAPVVYTVATLPPASSHRGRLFQVSDANATTRGSTAAGGGSNIMMVYSDNTNWLIL